MVKRRNRAIECSILLRLEAAHEAHDAPFSLPALLRHQAIETKKCKQKRSGKRSASRCE